MRNVNNNTSRATPRQGLAPAIIGADNVDEWLQEREEGAAPWGTQQKRLPARRVYE